MKVLHVIPSVDERSGGPATAIVPMCRALMQQGVEVLLISTDAGLAEKGEVSEYKGVPAKIFPAQLGGSFKYSRPLALWMSSHIREFDVTHIHAVFNHSSIAAAHVSRQALVPYVIRPLGTLEPWSLTQKSMRKHVFWQVTGRRMLEHAAAVHYTTEAERISTERFTGMNHGKVIPLGIEAADLTDLGSDSGNERYVLVLSRIHPKKGLEVLIDAFAHLDVAFAGWSLVIAGDGPVDYVAKLKKQALRVANGRIVFAGWVEGERKSALLSGASLLALPSYQENFGLCVIEALSYGVPVLVSPNVNLARDIAAAHAGWVVETDPEVLSHRLAEALSDRDELANRGRAGKELSHKYSWESAAKQLVQLYQEMFDSCSIRSRH